MCVCVCVCMYQVSQYHAGVHMSTAIEIFGNVAVSNWLGSCLMHEKGVCCYEP